MGIEQGSPSKAFLSVLLRSGVAGLIGAFLFGLNGAIADYTWQDYYCNTNLTPYMNIQSVGNVLLILLFTAIISVALTYRMINGFRGSLLPGAISGTVLVAIAPFFSLSASLIKLSPLFVVKEPGTYNMFDSFAENPIGYFLGFYSSGALVLLLYALIAAAIMAIIAAIYWALLLRSVKNEKALKNTNAIAIIVVIAAIIAVLVVPPAVAFWGLSSGAIEGSFHDYMDSVSVKRLDNGSLRIDYAGGPNLRLDKGQPYLIEINGNATVRGKNATNMDAIAQSGLSASIDPGYGLKSEKGSYVILSGPDIMPQNMNGYSGTHAVITIVLSSGERMVVFDSFIK